MPHPGSHSSCMRGETFSKLPREKGEQMVLRCLALSRVSGVLHKDTKRTEKPPAKDIFWLISLGGQRLSLKLF